MCAASKPQSAPVLVTGATGFVGSRLVEALSTLGIPVHACSRNPPENPDTPPSVQWFPVDFRSGEGLGVALRGTQAVIHLAGGARVIRESQIHTMNVSSLEQVLAVMETAEIPPKSLIVLSSTAAAGPGGAGPVSLYGKAKREAEQKALCSSIAHVTVLRVPGLYGPDDPRLEEWERGFRVGWLPMPANPHPLSWLHVDDCVHGLVNCLSTSHPTGLILGLDDGVPRTLPEYVRTLAESMNFPAPKVVPLPKPLLWSIALGAELRSRLQKRPAAFHRDKLRDGFAGPWVCDSSGAREHLSWTPTRTLSAEGLKKRPFRFPKRSPESSEAPMGRTD